MVKSYFKKPKLTKPEKDKMNAEVRVRDRVCQNCGKWCLISGNVDYKKPKGGDVHHKKTRGARGDAAWTLDNMELLCRECHTE